MIKSLILAVFCVLFTSCVVEVGGPVEPYSGGIAATADVVYTEDCLMTYEYHTDYGLEYPSSCYFYEDMECCVWEYYDNSLLCETHWCYDYYYCSWELQDEICYW